MRPCMGGEQGFDAHSPTVVAGPIMQAAVRRLSKVSLLRFFLLAWSRDG